MIVISIHSFVSKSFMNINIYRVIIVRNSDTDGES
jgi:hypothetical protein